MAREFQGTGWKFPVRIDPLGQIVMSHNEVDIEESIHLILSTAKGERQMRPDFGCGIHDLVFDAINAGLLVQVETEVRESLIFFEPRIDVINVEVSDKEAHNGQLLVNIDYRVRDTNSEFNLVFPFYLNEGIG